MTKTISIRLEDRLLKRIDRSARSAGKKRSDVIRDALQEWVRASSVRELEIREAEGYRKRPQSKDEYEPWLKVQAWPAE